MFSPRSTLLALLLVCLSPLAGSATEIISGHTEFDSETGEYTLSQGVKLTSSQLLSDQPVEFEAEKIVFNPGESRLRTYGETSVILTESGLRMKGEDLRYDGESQSGSFSNIRAKLPLDLSTGLRQAIAGAGGDQFQVTTQRKRAADRFIADRSTLYVLRGELEFTSGPAQFPMLEFHDVRLASTPRQGANLYLTVDRMRVVPERYVRLANVSFHIQGINLATWPALQINLTSQPGGFTPGLPSVDSNDVTGTLISLNPVYSLGPVTATGRLNYSTKEDYLQGFEFDFGNRAEQGRFTFYTGEFIREDIEGDAVFVKRDWALGYEKLFAPDSGAVESVELGAEYGKHQEESFPEDADPRIVSDDRATLRSRVQFKPIQLGESWSITSELFARGYHYESQSDIYRVAGGTIGLNYRSNLGNNYLAFTQRERTGPTPFLSDRNRFEKELNAGAITRISDHWLFSADYRRDMERNETEDLRLRLHYLYDSYNVQVYYNVADSGVGFNIGLLGADHYNPASEAARREHQSFR